MTSLHFDVNQLLENLGNMPPPLRVPFQCAPDHLSYKLFSLLASFYTIDPQKQILISMHSFYAHNEMST